MKKYIYLSFILAISISLIFVYYMIGNKYININDIKRNIEVYENRRIKIVDVQDINNEKYILYSSATQTDNFVGFALYTKKLFYNKYEYIASDKTTFELGKQYIKVNKSKKPHTLVVYGKNTNENIAYYKIAINGQEIIKDISNSNIFMNIYKYEIDKNAKAEVVDVAVFDKFYNYIGTR